MIMMYDLWSHDRPLSQKAMVVYSDGHNVLIEVEGAVSFCGYPCYLAELVCSLHGMHICSGACSMPETKRCRKLVLYRDK